MKELSDTAHKLLEAAHTLILEKGYNAFSYADLADVVGIRKASIHHHFPAKADLVATLLGEYRKHAAGMIIERQAHVTQAGDQLRAFCDYWAGCLQSGRQSICLAALLSAELPSLPPSVQTGVRGHFEDLGGWLSSVFRRLKPQDPASEAEENAQHFMALTHGAMLSARALGRPDLFRTTTDHNLKQLGL
jgi:TetR/AcrR family transcriptional repressor of nem operon